MKGLTRADIDRAESKDFALGDKPIRPRDAATLLLLTPVFANVPRAALAAGVGMVMGQQPRQGAVGAAGRRVLDGAANGGEHTAADIKFVLATHVDKETR